jgi:hypothetical protein
MIDCLRKHEHIHQALMAKDHGIALHSKGTIAQVSRQTAAGMRH